MSSMTGRSASQSDDEKELQEIKRRIDEVLSTLSLEELQQLVAEIEKCLPRRGTGGDASCAERAGSASPANPQ